LQTIGGVNLVIEKDESGDQLRWTLKARWTPTGLVERELILHTSSSGWEISYRLGAAASMLRHAYEGGRVDASLGF
jgi:hypothetical protein